MDLVKVKAIEKTYDSKQVLRDVNLTIQEGEFFTLLGPSGCGKTTLLRIIAGFVNPDCGQVLFDEKDITRLAAENRNVGMVFQNYALFPFMNVFENVAYGLKVKNTHKKKIKDQVKRYLELVNLTGYEERNVSELSGGEQQRVALARALVTSPRLLLLDEPLSNLDARLRDRMRTELKEIQSKLGITCIFVTHDQKEALTMSDRIAVFNEGKCIQVGRPKEIYSNPINTFVAKFIGETNLFSATIEGRKARLNELIIMTLASDQKGAYISIRPQDIGISGREIHGENTYKAIIEKIIISGDLVEYIVTAHNLEFKVIKLNTLSTIDSFEVGDFVWITIEPQVIHVLQQ